MGSYFWGASIFLDPLRGLGKANSQQEQLASAALHARGAQAGQSRTPGVRGRKENHGRFASLGQAREIVEPVRKLLNPRRCILGTDNQPRLTQEWS